MTDSQECYDRGVRFYQNGDYDQAIEAFTNALEIDEKNSAALIQRGLSYFERGQSFRCDPDMRCALTDLNKAVEVDPQNPRAYCSRARVYSRKAPDKARDDYQAVLELQVSGADGFCVRAEAHMGLDQYARAIEEYDGAIGCE